MTTAQKMLAVAGLVAIGITAAFAPYRFTAHNQLERIAGGQGSRYSGVVHAPLWNPPQDYRTELLAPQWLSQRSSPGTVLDDLQLDAGRLGLWWGGIAALTIVAIVVDAPRRSLPS